MSTEADHSEELDARLRTRLKEVASCFEPTFDGADVLPEVRERASRRTELHHRRRLLSAAAAVVLLVGGGTGVATLLAWPGGSSQGDVQTYDGSDGPVAPSPSDPSDTQPDPSEATGEAFDLQDLPDPPLAPRWKTAMVWTGEELVIWGGELDAANMGISSAESTTYTDGAAYNPVTREWRVLPDAPLPGGREIQTTQPQAVWTGTELFVVENGQAATWNPDTDSWREVPSPPGEGTLGLVATDDEVIQLDPGAGASWDPGTNEWEALPDPPAQFDDGIAVWTGQEVVLVAETVGAAYDPGIDEWRTVDSADLMSAVAATWTGQEILVAGYDTDRTAATYDPTSDTWEELPRIPLPDQEGIPSVHMVGDTPVVWSYAGTAVLLDGGWYPVPDATDGFDVVPGSGVLWTIGFHPNQESLTLSGYLPPTSAEELGESVVRVGFSDLRLPAGFAADRFESIGPVGYDAQLVAKVSGLGGACDIASAPGEPSEGEAFTVDPVDGPTFPAVRTEPGHVDVAEGEHRVIEIACDAPDDADTLVRHLTPWSWPG